MKRALDLCKEATVTYKDDILRALLGARKRRWEASSAQTVCRLQMAEALAETLPDGMDEGDGLGEEASEAKACVVQAVRELRRRQEPARVPEYLCCQISMEVRRVAPTVRITPPPRSTSFHLVLPRSTSRRTGPPQVMLDPVTTPCGVTYERSLLVDHLRKVRRSHSARVPAAPRDLVRAVAGAAWRSVR